MKSEKVKITVSIPTFNRLALLKRTLESVFNQREEPDEVIVVDNCSTDGTWEYLNTLPKIKAYRNKENIGVINNFNEAIHKATMDYIVILGSDDLLLPEYISTWKRTMVAIKRKDLAVFTCAGYIIDAEDRVKGVVKPFQQDRLFNPPSTVKIFWNNFYFSGMQASFWSLYLRTIFSQIGYFRDNYFRVIDADMTMRILPGFPLYYCAEPLGGYRIHPQQAFDEQIGGVDPQREFDDGKKSAQLLYDCERNPLIRRSFSITEQKDRIFIRKPLAFFLIVACYYLLRLDMRRARGYLRLFGDFYPRPYVSLLILRLLGGWLLELVRQNRRNLTVRRQFHGRRVLDKYYMVR